MESLYFKHRKGQWSLTRKHLPKHIQVPRNDKRWNTKRTFNLIEPRSDEVAALLRRRAARETGGGKFQLHRNTEATTSWHSFRLWGRRLLDERRDEWAWKATADSGFNSLTDWAQYAFDAGGCVSQRFIFTFLHSRFFCDRRIRRLLPGTHARIKKTPQKKSIPTADRFLKRIFSNVVEVRIDSCLFFFMKLIIWFDGRTDKSPCRRRYSAGKKKKRFSSWFPWTPLQSWLGAWLAVPGLLSVSVLKPLSLGPNVYK